MKIGFIACAIVTIMCIILAITIFYNLMANRINLHRKLCTTIAVLLATYAALSTSTIVECNHGEWSWLRFSLLTSLVFGSVLVISSFIDTGKKRWTYIKEKRRNKEIWWR